MHLRICWIHNVTAWGDVSQTWLHTRKTLPVKSLSCVSLFETPWTVAYQAPPSMEFSRQEYWSGLPFPSRGDLPDPGIEPRSPALQADALPFEPPGKPKSLWGVKNIMMAGVMPPEILSWFLSCVALVVGYLEL